MKNRAWMGIVLALLLVTTAVSGCTNDTGTTETAGALMAKADSYSVTIDVNPSISLSVEGGVVTGATAYNDDGQTLLLGVDVTGLGVEQAISVLTTALADAGYLTGDGEEEPVLIITVSGNESEQEDGEVAKQLCEFAQEALEGRELNCRIGAVQVSDEDVAAAQAYGISVGRYLLFEYISQVDGLTMEEVIALYGTTKIGVLLSMYEGAEGSL